MNFEDEEYVRLYSRDTVTMKKIGWEGRTVLWHIMRKVESSGVLELEDGDDEAEAVALLCDVPVDLARIGLDKLASRGVTQRHGSSLVLVRFVEAQTARRSDRLRAQDYRDRQKIKLLEEIEQSSRGVTANHDSSLPASPLHLPALPPPAEERARDLESGISETAPTADLAPRPLSAARRQLLALQPAESEDMAILRAWQTRFKKTDVGSTADRTALLADRRLEGMTHQDALDAIAGAAGDDWFMRQGATFSLIFRKAERFETYRDAGRALRGAAPPDDRAARSQEAQRKHDAWKLEQERKATEEATARLRERGIDPENLSGLDLKKLVAGIG